MTEDIVTRLRRHAYAGVPSYTKQLDSEAADEIERLREAMRLMYAHYHADNGAELVATYEKMVRGE